MRRSRSWFLALLTGGLFMATVAGLAAPVESRFDLVNHFRPHLLVAASGLAFICLVVGRWRLARWAAAIAGLNLLMALPALYVAAEKAPDGGATLDIVTFNVWGENPSPGRVEAMLRAHSADIVFLAEAGPAAADMLDRLKDVYPHQVDCVSRRYCHLALLSRHQFAEAEAVDRDESGPPHIVARLRDQNVTVYGVHLARPFGRGWQDGEIDKLIPRLRALDGPLLVMGDFNATPWSWALTRLARGAGLARHGLLGASWPADGVLPPQLLIDHVLSSRDIGSVAIGTGEEVGSDHLPVMARVRLP